MSNPLKEITNLPVNESVLVTPVKAATTKPAKVKKAAAAPKPIKATKAAAPKPKKAAKTAAAKHDYPSYIDMIREAILSLENPKNGVSRIAILKVNIQNFCLVF
jgi:hypothetical protein